MSSCFVFVFSVVKIEYVSSLDCWLDKTSSLKTSSLIRATELYGSLFSRLMDNGDCYLTVIGADVHGYVI